jgi:hypothetical protein
MSAIRKSRSYKEKSPMFAFGNFAMPLAAVVAIGLLFVGIKLFFLTAPENAGIEVPMNNANGPLVAAATVVPVTPEPVADVGTSASSPTVTVNTGVKIALAGPMSPTGNVRQQQNYAPPIEKVRDEGKMAAVYGVQAPDTRRPAAQNNSSGSTTRKNVQDNAKWAVQVGAFVNQDGARTLLDEVKKQGYTANISTAQSSGKTFHRVRVAAGNTRNEAETLASELEKKGYPVSVVPAR